MMKGKILYLTTHTAMGIATSDDSQAHHNSHPQIANSGYLQKARLLCVLIFWVFP